MVSIVGVYSLSHATYNTLHGRHHEMGSYIKQHVTQRCRFPSTCSELFGNAPTYQSIPKIYTLL